MMQKIALITGSNGFIGSHLTEYLLQQKFHVRCMIRKTSNLQWLKSLNIETVYADLSDLKALDQAVKNVDYVFHLGGKTKSSTREDFFLSNDVGTQHLLQATYKMNEKLKRFVYLSSQAAGGPSQGLNPRKVNESPAPVTWYGESKLAGEHAVLQYADRLPVTIIRAPSVYGPRDTDVFEVFRAVRFHIKAVLGWEKHYASLIYIDDLVQGIVLTAFSEKAIGEIFYLVSDEVVSWHKLNDTIAKAMNIKAITLHLPVWMLSIVAILREFNTRITGKTSIINRQKMNEFRQRFWICDGSKARSILGFQPKFTLERGVDETLKWYRENRWL